MNPPLPRPSPFVYVAFLIAALGLTALATWLGAEEHKTYPWRLAHDAVNGLAGLAIGVFAASAVIGVLQRRQWRRQTRVVAFDLYATAQRQCAVLASQSVWVATGDSDKSYRMYDVLERPLPWSTAREQDVGEVAHGIAIGVLGVLNGGDGDGQPLAQVAERIDQAESELDDRCRRLREVVHELGSYVEPKHAGRLYTSAADVSASFREATTWLPSNRTRDLDAVRALGVLGILEATRRVAAALSDAYSDQRKRLGPSDKVSEELRSRERQGAEDDASDASDQGT